LLLCVLEGEDKAPGQREKTPPLVFRMPVEALFYRGHRIHIPMEKKPKIGLFWIDTDGRKKAY